MFSHVMMWLAGPGFLPLRPIFGGYCKQGSCPERLQSLDSIPQCLPYRLDDVSVRMDT